MAEKRRFLDVWIVDGNTVYREVPFTVVADWVQQGRLLEDDMLRPSGTAEWFKVGASPDFSPYLPHPEPHHADDQAEALAPVELDFRFNKQHHEEDDDVDMIPLIDVSLVLLIFFMLTATGVGAAALGIPLPETIMGEVYENPGAVWVGVRLQEEGGRQVPVYSIGIGPAQREGGFRTQQELLDHLQQYLDKMPGKVELSINADKRTESEVVRNLTLGLQEKRFRNKISKLFDGVGDKLP